MVSAGTGLSLTHQAVAVGTELLTSPTSPRSASFQVSGAQRGKEVFPRCLDHLRFAVWRDDILDTRDRGGELLVTKDFGDPAREVVAGAVVA
jgi:hypothetical protein